MEHQPPNYTGGERPEEVPLQPTVPEELGDQLYERRTNKEILIAARASIEAVADQVQETESRLALRGLVQHLIDSDDRRIPSHLIRPSMIPGHPDYQDTLASARDAAIFGLWSRSKVVYAMDEHLLRYFSESASSQVPTQIFGNLPHPDPYVLLPKPDFNDPETSYYRRHIGVPLGAFVFGRYNDAQQLCSTTADQREDLGLMFAGFIETDTGPVLQVLRCTVPLRQNTFSVEDAIEATIAKFHFNDDLGEDDHRKLEGWLRKYVGQAMSSLLYVCTDQPDVQVEEPGGHRRGKPAKSRARRRPRPGDIGTVVKLGFRMGPALYETQRRWEAGERREAAEGAGIGTRKRPHMKRPHIRTYWTGPGGQVPVAKWIAPFWVNKELLDDGAGPADVVVRPVQKRPKGPAAQR
ncbi:MAG TPA: hypothetical protein VHX38_30100 [Pseudonocardiaceae bacterium]|jgi:hypothetical protein|nr:hypothetical protein [Pseudonocardiaceae bacterium]